MPRRSQRIDHALLASGRALYPRLGSARLSLRALADHAGANLGMFHYHFGSKENFLRTLLQQLYEEMFGALAERSRAEGPALERLRGTLLAAGGILREHRRLLARVWMDALAGDAVALDFMRRNAPRHLGLLLALLDEAEREGALRTQPPLQRCAFVVGAVALPMVFAAGLVETAFEPKARRQFAPQVMSDEAVRERVDLALGALRAPARRAAGPRASRRKLHA